MKVCIDAGHGGKDGGAQGATVAEKWITLDVANRVAQKLRNSAIEVVLTRDSDYFVELAERANLSNRAGADVFISIHCNSASPEARGTEVWTYPGEAQDRRLAQDILSRLVARTGFRDRGVKEENFAVLRLTRCPAALVELGFISNPQEEQIMKTFDYQDQASTAIVEGIKEFAGIREPEEPPTEVEPPAEVDPPMVAAHWAQAYLDALQAKGLIQNPAEWQDFDSPATKGQVLALCAKLADRL